jgi:hypothetical protein
VVGASTRVVDRNCSLGALLIDSGCGGEVGCGQLDAGGAATEIRQLSHLGRIRLDP